MKRLALLMFFFGFVMTNAVRGDVKNIGGGDALNPLKISLYTENGQKGEELTFEVDPSIKSSSLGTCTMNPQDGRGMPVNMLLESPNETMASVTDFVSFSDATDEDNPPPPTIPSSPLPTPPIPTPVPPVTPPGPPAATPEPGTLLILGIGAAALYPLARSRMRRKSND